MGPNQTGSVDKKVGKSSLSTNRSGRMEVSATGGNRKNPSAERPIGFETSSVMRAHGVRETRTLGVTADTLPVIPTEMTEKEKQRRRRDEAAKWHGHTLRRLYFDQRR